MKVLVAKCKHGKVIAVSLKSASLPEEIGDWLLRGYAVATVEGPVTIGGGCGECLNRGAESSEPSPEPEEKERPMNDLHTTDEDVQSVTKREKLTVLGAALGCTTVVRCDCCREIVERLFASDISGRNLCGPCWDREQEENWGATKGIHLIGGNDDGR